MDAEHLVTLDEIADYIRIQNPQGRKCVINKEKRGWEDGQIFASDIFPDEIEGVHVKILTKKIGHPVFCLEPSNKKLVLQGWRGYSYGPDIIDEICNELISTKYCCTARSIKRAEYGLLENGTDEGYQYWISSRCDKEYGLYRVIKGEIRKCILFDPDDYEEDYADYIRPIIIFDNVSIVDFNTI